MQQPLLKACLLITRHTNTLGALLVDLRTEFFSGRMCGIHPAA